MKILASKSFNGNLDPNKQTNEVASSRKSNSNNFLCPVVKANNNDIAICPHWKHFGISLDSKLNLNTYVEQKIKKCNKIIGLTKRLSVNVLWNASLTIYKSFIRPHIHDVVVSYDKSKKLNF